MHRIGIGAAALLAGAAVPGPAAAQYYIGPSFLEVPGVPGGAKEAQHRDWVRAEAYYWTKRPELREIRGIHGASSGLQFTGPQAPRKGPDVLSIAVAKDGAAYAPMMALCRANTRIPEATFAESTELTRHPAEHGPRPAGVPAFYQYALKGVTLACPEAAGAPEQAFEVRFEDIIWKSAELRSEPVPITTQPVKLPAAPRSGSSRSFVVTWFAAVADSRDDQCPAMNTKPAQDDYYALMTPERAAAQKAALADKGGVNTQYLPYRGPGEMNVTMLPGIVADPGFAAPQVDVVRGFDLDDDDGSGPPPRGIRRHRNFVSPEGARGIDNQLFTIKGCIAGWRRHGFLPMVSNEGRRAGALSIMVDISGIDDPRNDDDVAVTILYSTDPMRRDGTSKVVLSDYTFGVSGNGEFTQDFARFRAKIVDGVITTSVLPAVYMHESASGIGWTMQQARMRLTINPDGTLTALLGGYRDWREYVRSAFFRSSDYENTIGFKTPGMYNAIRRAADGLQDPETGEYLGLSAAYDIEGVPAFIPPEQHRRLISGGAYVATSGRSAPASRR